MNQRRLSVSRQHGFTVLELLATLLVAGALIALTFWIAHPREFAAVDRNAARWTDIAQLLQATRRYAADTGSLPPGITDKETEIGSAKDMVDVCKAFVPDYMKDIPLDPTDGGQYAVVDCRGTASQPGRYVTGYSIWQADDGTVTIAAPAAEQDVDIRVTYKF